MTHAPNTLREIEDLPDMGITLSDGTRLSARVWRPVDADDDPVPAILEYLPYRKRDGTAGRDALTHPYFAARGYACIRVDMRGNGDSEGLMEDEYTAQELADGVEVINWLAAQPWCTGKVGMMGISWGGFNGLQIAALGPDPLQAVITLCSTVDRYADDIHYKGGCLLNENLGWGATMWAYSSRPPDPALRDNWREMWLQRLEAEPYLPALWLRHQRRDAYWRHGSVCEDYSRLTARVLAVGGWGDAYKNTVPRIVADLPGSKGILGPWVHKYPHFAVPEPRIGFLQEALRWWDRWLKDVQNGAEDDPDMRSYLMDGVRPATWYDRRDGLWQADPQADPITLHLTDTGLSADDGPLDRVVASPQDCGMDGGEYCAIWLGPEMPGDQRRDDALSACFDGAPLDADMDISGAPRITLAVSCDRPTAQIAVRLCHLHGDGASTRITYGVLNLCHRDSHADPAPLPIGKTVRVTLDLDHIAYRVPAGDRLRVSVSSAYWPLIWPSPEKTTLRLESGDIVLPVTPTPASQWTFPEPDAADPWQTRQLRDPDHIRRVEQDQQTGLVSLIVEDDFGVVEDAGHGFFGGTIARERWVIHPDEPQSARGICHWTDERGRADWSVRTETRSEMWSDATHFHLEASLEAFENGEQVFSKSFKDSIPRDHM